MYILQSYLFSDRLCFLNMLGIKLCTLRCGSYVSPLVFALLIMYSADQLQGERCKLSMTGKIWFVFKLDSVNIIISVC